jgi:hypothetical protein
MRRTDWAGPAPGSPGRVFVNPRSFREVPAAPLLGLRCSFTESDRREAIRQLTPVYHGDPFKSLLQREGAFEPQDLFAISSRDHSTTGTPKWTHTPPFASESHLCGPLSNFITSRLGRCSSATWLA